MYINGDLCFRLKAFKASLLTLFKKEHAQSLELEKVREFVGRESAEEWSEEELLAAIHTMMDDNQAMLSENVVFLI